MIDQTTATAYDGAEPCAGSGRPAAASFEGDVIGWVATHRRHHAFTDRPGDPHSPYRYGSSLTRAAPRPRARPHGLAARHVFGACPFATRRHDRATNLWPLALVSFGESWHNMHHSDPACARHGADPGQVDMSAAVIRVFERLGWATMVRWPTPARLDSRRSERI
jgi:fatty-acid desaturase